MILESNQSRKNMSVNQEPSKKIINLQQFYSGDENRAKQMLMLQNQIKKKNSILIQDIKNLDNQIQQETMEINEDKKTRNDDLSSRINQIGGDSNRLKKNLFEQFSKIQINTNLKVNLFGYDSQARKGINL